MVISLIRTWLFSHLKLPNVLQLSWFHFIDLKLLRNLWSWIVGLLLLMELMLLVILSHVPHTWVTSLFFSCNALDVYLFLLSRVFLNFLHLPLLSLSFPSPSPHLHPQKLRYRYFVSSSPKHSISHFSPFSCFCVKPFIALIFFHFFLGCSWNDF